MALILGVNAKSSFYINDIAVQVLRTEGHHLIVLDVEGERFSITDQDSVEIYPQVFVSCGIPSKSKDQEFQMMPRLVIEAPRDIVVLREELYHKRKKPA